MLWRIGRRGGRRGGRERDEQSQERKRKDKTSGVRKKRKEMGLARSGRGAAGIELATERIVRDIPTCSFSQLHARGVGSPSRGSLHHPSRAWVRSDVTSEFTTAARAAGVR